MYVSEKGILGHLNFGCYVYKSQLSVLLNLVSFCCRELTLNGTVGN